MGDPGVPVAGLIAMRAPTVKLILWIEEAGVEGPLALILWGPPDEAGILKLAVQDPFPSADVEPAVVLSKVKVTLSFAPKPEPVAVTEVPAIPLVGLIEEKVGVTIKERSGAEVVVPWARMGYEPPGLGGTVKVTVHAPLELTVGVKPT